MARAGALFVALLLVATAAAAGVGGAPRFESCVGPEGTCAGAPSGALRGVAGLAVAPDGRHLYASAFGGDAVSAFRIGDGGRLRFDGCVADESAAVPGCATAPEGVLEGPAGLATSGGSLFVASETSSTVTRLALHGGGRPTFGRCLAALRGVCAGPAGAQSSLRGAVALAAGPGGRDLYLAATDANALTRLGTGGGGLSVKGCIAYAGAFGCRRARKNSLVGADAIAVAPHGRAAYAAAFSSAAVTELGRSRSGALAYRGCVGDRGPADCRPLRHGTLTGAAGIAVAPDGRAVFVASQVGTVTRFAVTRGGRLAFSGCIGDGRLAGCAPAPHHILAGATGIVVAPDGRTVYVAARGANAIVALSGIGTVPSFRGCVRAGGGHGCAGAPAKPLRGAYALAGDPRGNSLFVAASGGSAIGSFAVR